MQIRQLFLQNFRSYKKGESQFANLTLIVGPNTSGKTNIIEAIYLLARGKSFRADLEREMINYQAQMSNVKCQMSDENNILSLEIILTIGEVQGKKVAKKLFRVNDVGKRMIDFVGNLRVVKFGPEDINIILGSPARRRGWLDSILEQTSRDYWRSLSAYQKGIRQRNKLLFLIKEGKASPIQLEFWNRLVIKNGQIITQKRQDLIKFINQLWSNLAIFYDKSEISQDRLEQYKDAELALGATLVGPHRDNIKFKLEGRDLALFGSRGEQRMAILSAKIAELEFVREQSVSRPVLLLDDIFSELDQEHRREVMTKIDNQQTIITTTDSHLVPEGFLGKMKVINL
jgi:DNA replication and repair protein RecF